MGLVINFIGFQLGWFAAVLGGANDLAWAGTLAALTVIAIHLVRVPRPAKELQLVLLTGLFGFAWDSLLVRFGITVYPSGVFLDGAAPHWIVAMWMLFATTLNVSMRWLRGRLWLAAGLGGVFGPLAFYAGSELGGVFFPHPFAALPILAAGWAVFMPLLMLLAERMDGSSGAREGKEIQYV